MQGCNELPKGDRTDYSDAFDGVEVGKASKYLNGGFQLLSSLFLANNTALACSSRVCMHAKCSLQFGANVEPLMRLEIVNWDCAMPFTGNAYPSYAC